jgi:hypothetical protein
VSTPPPTGYPPAGYPPTGYPPPPGWQAGPPPQQPRRARRGCLYVFLGVVGVLVLLVIVAVAVGSHNGTKTGTTPATPGGTQTTLAGIGDPVRDGKFQFTVTKITHVKRVGNSLLGQNAQGEYTILHVTVTNISSVAQTLDDSAQYVYDSHGRKFSADSTADIYANGSSNSVFFNSINPGNSVHGKIAFDLPVGDTAVKAELHDSAFSGGVTVRLVSPSSYTGALPGPTRTRTINQISHQKTSLASPPASQPAVTAFGCKILQIGSLGQEEFQVFPVDNITYNGVVNVSFYDYAGSGHTFPGTSLQGVSATPSWNPVPGADIGASAEPSGCIASAG